MSNPTLDVLNQHMSIRSFTDEMVSDQQVSERFVRQLLGLI